MQWTAWGGWLAGLGWLLLRVGGGEAAVLGSELESGKLQPYLFLDWSWLLLLAAAVLFSRKPPSERSARAAVWVLTLVTFMQHALLALTRYYAGRALAWDLANYVQPLWRAAHGLSMTSAAYGDRAIWADHGAFAMFLFAPLTRIGSDAVSALLLVQSALAAASVLACYVAARALSLSVHSALCVAAVLASSRALANAAAFDFHPECALPILLLLTVQAREKGRWLVATFATLVAVTLRDMAAFTMAMLWLYWALTTRDRRAALLAVAGLLVGCFDVFVLPSLSGWYSYLSLNTSADVDIGVALASTLLRSMSTFGLGWLHPSTWFSGAPWLLAAALSPKLAVKGIDFQYGFLYVPVAALGAMYALRWLQAHRASLVPAVSCAWVALAVAPNAPQASSFSALRGARSAFEQLHGELTQRLPREARIAADACAAPYAIERPHLTLLCRLDVETLQRTGKEKWDAPVENSLSATHLLVRDDCQAHRACVASMLASAQRMHGFAVAANIGPFVVLSRKQARP